MNDVLRNTLDALSKSTSSGEDRWERMRSTEDAKELKRKEKKISAAAGPVKSEKKSKPRKFEKPENSASEKSSSEKTNRSANSKSSSKKSKSKTSKSNKPKNEAPTTSEKTKTPLKATRTITVAQPPRQAPQPLSRKPMNNSLDSLSTIPSSYQVPPSESAQPIAAPVVLAKPKLNATQLAQQKDADERAFMAKLQARKNAAEPGNTDVVDFKPRTEIEHAAVLEVAGKLKPKPRTVSAPRKFEKTHVPAPKPEIVKATPVKSDKSKSLSAKSEEPEPAQTTQPDIAKDLTGIKNSGNNCYISTALQCLYRMEDLREFLLSGEYKKHLNKTSPADGEIAELTSEIFGKMKNLESNISIEDLKDAVSEFSGMFENDEQEDAEEFLLTLIDGLHLDLEKSSGFVESANVPNSSEEAWNQYISEENSFLTSLFVGQAESTLTCLACQESTKNWESFWNISLPISGSSSIEECIEKFQKSETLTGEDQPFCESCQKKCDMTKSLRISKIPRTLLLHLKRFSSKSKDSSLIKFPVDSSLSLESSEFKLSSVINHQGKSTSSGHYLASVRHNGNWFSISDEKISSLEKVESADAYVLFYTSQ
ncbi:unnamed protein product [Oikopleura dioica]|uniref:ubiquitinyl hydrolase 1 n=1 Tax=Oikopleura dioica TaxID=34765 RepID=E4X1Q1_OIKDI|nr:unnamed protein product [Oikopleura dioica]